MIIVYSTPACRFCHKVKEFLMEHGLPFTEKDATNREVYDEMMAKAGVMSVPVTDFNGSIVVGWDKQKLLELTAPQE